jgi:hypothetical protein
MRKPSARAKGIISKINRLYERFLCLSAEQQRETIALIERSIQRCTDKAIAEIFIGLKELLEMNLKPEVPR